MGDPFVGAIGVYYHAAQLWTSARDLAQRFERAETDNDPSRTPAGLSVILFAAFSVETLLRASRPSPGSSWHAFTTRNSSAILPPAPPNHSSRGTRRQRSADGP